MSEMKMVLCKVQGATASPSMSSMYYSRGMDDLLHIHTM